MRRHKSGCYCINLRRAVGAVSAFYDRELAPIELTVNQFSLLRNLSRVEPCSVSTLAAYVGLERTTLVRTLKPMLERGLIADMAASGQRNRVLQLTEQGRMVMQQGVPLWEQAQAETMQCIGEENMQTFLEILDRLEQL